MKECKYCKTEIDSKAKVCPNCRKKQGPKIGRWIVLGIIVLAIMGIYAGNQVEKERKKDFKQNEVATYENVKYSIVKVEKSQGSDFFKPKDGYEFVVVTIKIENKSDNKVSYNALDWKMVDSNGVEESYTLFTDTNDTDLGSGDLNANGTKEGTVAFEQKLGDTDLVLKYYKNILESNYTIQFKLD